MNYNGTKPSAQATALQAVGSPSASAQASVTEDPREGVDRSDASERPGFQPYDEDECDDATIARPSSRAVGPFASAKPVEPEVPEAASTTRDLDEEDVDEDEVETILDPMPVGRARQAAAPSCSMPDPSPAADPPTLVPSSLPPRSSSPEALSVRRIPPPSVRPHPALRSLAPPAPSHLDSRPLPPRPKMPSHGSFPMSERVTMRPPPREEVGSARDEDALEPPTLPRDPTSAPEPPTFARSRSPSVPSVHQRVAFPAPQFSPPRQPQPFVVPVAPVTHRMLDAENTLTPVHEIAQVVRRPSAPLAFGNLQAPSSIAPVAMSTALRLGSRADRTVNVRAPRRFTPAAAMAAFVLAGLLATSVVGVVAFVPGARATVDERLGSSEKKPVAASPPADTPVPPSSVVVPPPAHVPPVTLDLRPPVEPDMTYVTFPESAQGHRVYVDGQILGTGAEPTKIKCGPHTIKIGAAGKVRSVDLPCGDDFAFPE